MFAYLCDLSYDNDKHFIELYMSIFNIYFINTKPFKMGIEDAYCVFQKVLLRNGDKNQ